jgi:hypothetical protein
MAEIKNSTNELGSGPLAAAAGTLDFRERKSAFTEVHRSRGHCRG